MIFIMQKIKTCQDFPSHFVISSYILYALDFEVITNPTVFACLFVFG